MNKDDGPLSDGGKMHCPPSPLPLSQTFSRAEHRLRAGGQSRSILFCGKGYTAIGSVALFVRGSVPQGYSKARDTIRGNLLAVTEFL